MLENQNNNIYLGSHISFGAPDYFLGSIKEAASFNENTFMFYTGAPQNSKRVPFEKCKIKEGLELLKNLSFKTDKLVVHAPYIINLANSINEETFEISKKILINEIIRTNAFKVKYLVLHPGSHLGAGVEKGLNKVVEGLNDVLKETKDIDVTICLETMAGKGNEIGKTFEELGYIIEHTNFKDKLGVCFDTCHTFDSGINIDDIDETLNHFDKIIGLNRLKVIHLNDSKNLLGSHKDRHENIGKGNIGLKTLLKYVYDERLIEVPKILETPYINGLPPYKDEIALIRSFSN